VGLSEWMSDLRPVGDKSFWRRVTVTWMMPYLIRGHIVSVPSMFFVQKHYIH